MKKIFLGLCIIMLNSAFGLEYEKTRYSSVEYGKNLKDWHLYTSTKGEVTKVDDGFKFTGKGTSTGFYTRFDPIYVYGDTLRFRIKYSHYFKIYIQVMTTKGIRYITYYPLDKDLGKNGRFIQIGLGKRAKNGKWNEFSRDLKADLEKFEDDNKILEVRAFFIRGSGQVNYIELFNMRVEYLHSRNKLTNLIKQDPRLSPLPLDSKSPSFGKNVIVGATTNTNMPKETRFYTLSKDEKSKHLMLTINTPFFCGGRSSAVVFNKENTIMTVQYSASGSSSCSPLWQDRYDISDIYNPKRLSHNQYP